MLSFLFGCFFKGAAVRNTKTRFDQEDNLALTKALTKGEARKLPCRVGLKMVTFSVLLLNMYVIGGKQLVECPALCVHFHWLAFAKDFHHGNETLTWV